MTTKHWLGTAAIILAIGTGSGVAFAQGQPETKHEEGRGGAAASSHETTRGETMNRGEAKGGAAGERAGSEARQGGKEAQGPAGSAREREQAESRESKPAGGQSAQQSTKGERDQSAQREREGREAKDASKDASKDESRQKQGAAEERRGENKSAAETNKTENNKAENNRADTNKAESNKTESNKAESNKAESNKAAQSGQQRQDREADRHDRNPAGTTQQSQDEHKGRGSNEAADKQQGGDRSNQATQSARPNNTTTQQNSQTEQGQRNAAGQQQNNATGQAQNQTDRGRSSTTVSVNDQQRTRVVDQLRRDHDFDKARTDIDIRVNVGERLPERVRPRPLPTDIVNIVPEYRGYDYTVVHDEIAIVDPRSREIVDVIPQDGGRADRYAGDYGSGRVRLSDEQRQILFRSATAAGTVGSTSSSSGSSSSGSTCLSLRRVPDELARSNPELASYEYLAIGDQVILVDPQNQKVVQVIDQQQQSQQ
jgi:Protein of unknown function (DUF1236)